MLMTDPVITRLETTEEEMPEKATYITNGNVSVYVKEGTDLNKPLSVGYTKDDVKPFIFNHDDSSVVCMWSLDFDTELTDYELIGVDAQQTRAKQILDITYSSEHTKLNVSVAAYMYGGNPDNEMDIYLYFRSLDNMGEILKVYINIDIHGICMHKTKTLPFRPLHLSDRLRSYIPPILSDITYCHSKDREYVEKSKYFSDIIDIYFYDDLQQLGRMIEEQKKKNIFVANIIQTDNVGEDTLSAMFRSLRLLYVVSDDPVQLRKIGKYRNLREEDFKCH